jgi:hypothetical protein
MDLEAPGLGSKSGEESRPTLPVSDQVHKAAVWRETPAAGLSVLLTCPRAWGSCNLSPGTIQVPNIAEESVPLIAEDDKRESARAGSQKTSLREPKGWSTR